MDVTTNQPGRFASAPSSPIQGEGTKGAYWGIMTEIAGYHLADALPSLRRPRGTS